MLEMSTNDSTTLPFTIGGAAGVQTERDGKPVVLYIPEVEGMLGMDPDALTLQYRVRDRAAAYDSGLREVRVPYTAVETLDLRRPWFGAPRLVLRVADLALLQTVPGA